jgi:hypothetical protein
MPEIAGFVLFLPIFFFMGKLLEAQARAITFTFHFISQSYHTETYVYLSLKNLLSYSCEDKKYDSYSVKDVLIANRTMSE